MTTLTRSAPAAQPDADGLSITDGHNWLAHQIRSSYQPTDVPGRFQHRNNGGWVWGTHAAWIADKHLRMDDESTQTCHEYVQSVYPKGATLDELFHDPSLYWHTWENRQFDPVFALSMMLGIDLNKIVSVSDHQDGRMADIVEEHLERALKGAWIEVCAGLQQGVSSK